MKLAVTIVFLLSSKTGIACDKKIVCAFYASVAPLVSNFCYSNDTDYKLGNTYLNAYYGDHVNRLMQIKRKYDPHNIFHWRQSIPP